MNNNLIATLQHQINSLHKRTIKLSLNEYDSLIELAVKAYEMKAVVFLYDSIKSNNLIPTKKTYYLINKLHSKTIQNNSKILVPIKNTNSLKPRRRIHKIMKGYNYSSNYNKALLHKQIAIEYLKSNPKIITLPRIKLAKKISKDCKISFNDARYIITHLKRTKFFINNKPNNNTITSYISNTMGDSKITSHISNQNSNKTCIKPTIRNILSDTKPTTLRKKHKKYGKQKTICDYFNKPL